MGDEKKELQLPEYIRQHIPQTDACKTALDLAWRALPEPIFNHSVRVFLFAKWLAQKESSEYLDARKLDLLFVACVCHDLGASHLHNGSQRFEVEGADAAKEHLLSYGVSESDSHQVWTAIAVHTSSGIAERIDPLSRLVRFAVLIDFRLATRQSMGAVEYSAEIETYLPRLNVEKALGDAVVNQADHTHERYDGLSWPNTQKHPSASWPGILLRAHVENPDHNGVNPAF